jgi:hypothetical protein
MATTVVQTITSGIGADRVRKQIVANPRAYDSQIMEGRGVSQLNLLFLHDP